MFSTDDSDVDSDVDSSNDGSFSENCSDDAFSGGEDSDKFTGDSSDSLCSIFSAKIADGKVKFWNNISIGTIILNFFVFK
ncbi:hypothetical protein F6X86_03620 [Enterococcus durans]|uniref:Uncharacterized protein n=1 Tax=Enterococcus durans TaxID=53345 RepID=A0A5N0YS62_9ENTE|nr:hypothetical protein [Enterococcus durans]KAA9180266.1 hypothetical protein F6X86_03620 [Enterococcus durans]KAA9187561.1 hypothetical protein F6X90_04250 [Enterococcus durans]KAA9192277.1 hypothetical protein F6Y12_04305 [Enterococcus durans]KAA9194692.1 hypothetical protein F6X87_06160 [Enterococcus durans]KAA9195485.1 hypothetical protein F6X88_01935 [Enterococcus durans]